MPELPEVETTRRGVAPLVLNQSISRVVVRNPRLRWPVPDDMEARLIGRVVTSVGRRGKYLVFGVGEGHLLVHLGMSGHLRWMAEMAMPGKHDHVDLVFGDGGVLRYTDPRRFGSFHWVSGDVGLHPLLEKMGPEPLLELFNADYLFARSRGRRVAIKSFVMDSQVVVGVGNIYACEALFLAGIDPAVAAGSVEQPRLEVLVSAIKCVLAKAIEQGGTTLRDFVGSDGRPGYFKQELQVYGRAGLSCHRCGGKVQTVRIGQRNTFFCPVCQAE